MKKSEMIDELKTRLTYCEDQMAHYEKLHGEEVANGESATCTIWTEMKEWYKGKINAYNVALEMAQELES